jgi:cytochrome b involved in lipid metabolism
MKFALLLIGLAVLLFGCVVQPTGPLEESLKPPAGLDVKDAMDTDSGQADAPDNGSIVSGENGTAVANESSNGTAVDSAELSMHNSLTDCWVLYDGEVYDVTGYLLQHPGGSQAIAAYCGKDDGSFKQAFEGQHGMSKAGLLQDMPNMGSHMGAMMGN